MERVIGANIELYMKLEDLTIGRCRIGGQNYKPTKAGPRSNDVGLGKFVQFVAYFTRAVASRVGKLSRDERRASNVNHRNGSTDDSGRVGKGSPGGSRGSSACVQPH